MATALFATALFSFVGNDFDATKDAFKVSFEKVQLIYDSKPKDFLLPMVVKGGRSGAGGKDLATNGLQGINGLYIAAISRSNEVFADADSTFVLQVGRRLVLDKAGIAFTPSPVAALATNVWMHMAAVIQASKSQATRCRMNGAPVCVAVAPHHVGCCAQPASCPAMRVNSKLYMHVMFSLSHSI